MEAEKEVTKGKNISTEGSTDDGRIDSTDLRVQTVGQFHAATVEDVFILGGSSGDFRPVESISEADVLGLKIKHPNDDSEYVFETIERVIQAGMDDLCAVEKGDTIWISDWDDIKSDGLQRVSRSYAVCSSREEAEHLSRKNGNMEKFIVKNAFLLFFKFLFGFALFVTPLIYFWPVLLTGLLTGGVLTGIYLLFLVTRTNEVSSEEQQFMGYPKIPTLFSVSEDYFNCFEDNPSIREEVREYAFALDSWTEAKVTKGTAEGVVECLPDGMSDTVDLKFEPPRKWDEKYPIVQLAQAFGVGSIEQLEGEQIEIRYVGDKDLWKKDVESIQTESGDFRIRIP